MACSEAEVAKKQADLRNRFGGRNSTWLEEGMLIGTPRQLIERIGQYQGYVRDDTVVHPNGLNFLVGFVALQW